MGLRIRVYRSHYDGEYPSDDAGGTVNQITVVNVEGPFTPNAEAPAYILERHHYYLKYPVLSPVDPTTGNAAGGMASGNYAGCSDGRWVDAVAAIVGARVVDLVTIHDRFETKEGS